MMMRQTLLAIILAVPALPIEDVCNSELDTCAVAAKDRSLLQHEASASQRLHLARESEVDFFERGETKADNVLGDPKCPCIGFEEQRGNIMVKLNASANGFAKYPGNLGAHCADWDNGLEPNHCQVGQQPGENNGWCSQKWCFVDPCNCDISVKPKTSSYLPQALYQGKRVYYSYATCKGKDTWNKKQKIPMTELKDTAVCKSKLPELEWGKEDCRCVGIAGMPGTFNFSYKSKSVVYPAETGGKCKPWDAQRNPDCIVKPNKTVKDLPAWCSKPWCFVDPCKCRLGKPPTHSTYSVAKLNGRPLFFSYDTCGAELPPASQVEVQGAACVRQSTEESCTKLDNCAWGGDTTGCSSAELVKVCRSAAARSQTVFRILLAVIALLLYLY
eukprot:TRINITY_DN32447_c0_g1_i1.p1 TRINITY_DN32447_c0_g1~~TRINITY_DN32447_c0_g1_i1.p1  ORF type:complete len:387 (+),score=61.91 TRINITY_DN32447_c0_g1_i1:140-1300(+)